MVFRSAGLRRPKFAPELQDRLPPGQYATQRWPVRHDGAIPPFDPATWDLRVFGLVARPLRLNWENVQRLPRVTIRADLHCVRRWSKLDNAWEGVPLRDLLRQAGVQPAARFVLVHCDAGYTANLPLAAVNRDDVLLATAHDGETLSAEHGFPMRLIVPDRYAWKSAKWVRGIELLAEDQPGFWERYGYHSNADIWREERFADEGDGGSTD